MINLPNPFAASDAAAEQAVASLSHAPAPSDAAADPFDSGATDCPPDKAAASLRHDAGAAVEFVDLDQTDCIGEIFVGARKLDALDAEYLFELDAGNHRRPNPRLDVAAFMQELDEAPLFLRRFG